MFLGGFGLFMFGVHLTSDGLQKFAASRLKQILQSITKKRFMAVISGIVMTVAFQSSAAANVLVVEFVNAEMMSLAQALNIVLGSAIGTSVSIQLIAFQMLDAALGIIFVGLIFYLGLGKRKWKYLGQTLIGFGVIFVGMAYMSQASAPLKDIPQVHYILTRLEAHQFLAILVGLVLTMFIQSSTAVFAIMMSLASQQLLTLEAIIPLVLGAHIGGTVTTLFSSLATQRMDAKRAAIANTGYKVVAAFLVYPLLTYFTRLVEWTTSDVQRQVANAHLLFAVFMVIIFLPFNPLIAKALVRWLPDKAEAAPPRQFKFIDEASLEVPTVALTQAFQEIRGLGEYIYNQMILKVRDMAEGSAEESNRIAHAEMDVDWYYRHIARFLSKLSQKGLTDDQMEEYVNAQFILKEFEYIGDELMGMAQLIHKLQQDDIALPKEEWAKLRELNEAVSNNFKLMLLSLKTWDPQPAEQILRAHPEIIRLQRALQFEALAQVPKGDSPEANTFAEEKLRYAIIDFINFHYSIDDHVVNIAQVVMGIV